MTPKERVELALGGGCGGIVPFTMYENKIPQCAVERALRNRGLCIVNRVRVFETHRPNVRHSREITWEDGVQLARDHYDTPAGHLTAVRQPAGFTSWRREFLFKSPDDFPALRAFIEDMQFEPRYEPVATAQRRFGGDAIFRGQIGLEPLQMLVSGDWFGTEQFCIQWMDNRDEMLRLADALVEKRRQIYPLVAASPVSHANYGGNVIPEIVGPENFETYYVPHYNEAAEVLHRAGKKIGSHFDGNCRLFAHAIAGSNLDYVEAFTPAPDTDLTLAGARAAWPDKVVWFNFPSSVHLRSDEEVEQFAVDMLDELPSVDGLICGITEDIPEDRWQASCTAIMDGLARHAREKPERYRAPS
ncbi:MAG: hypothetical protein R6V58_01440 [Planctomycetota bacterium]